MSAWRGLERGAWAAGESGGLVEGSTPLGAASAELEGAAAVVVIDDTTAAIDNLPPPVVLVQLAGPNAGLCEFYRLA